MHALVRKAALQFDVSMAESQARMNAKIASLGARQPGGDGSGPRRPVSARQPRRYDGRTRRRGARARRYALRHARDARAARSAKELGMLVCMGAPNYVRRKSHCGNLSAREAFRRRPRRHAVQRLPFSVAARQCCPLDRERHRSVRRCRVACAQSRAPSRPRRRIREHRARQARRPRGVSIARGICRCYPMLD